MTTERSRSELLLSQLELLQSKMLDEEAAAARALYEECAVSWGPKEFEQLRACNDRLKEGIRNLGKEKARPKPPSTSAFRLGTRLEGLEVQVDVLQPVVEDEGLALLAGAAHVRVSLPMGFAPGDPSPSFWGCDLTPLFDDNGDRLMVFVTSLPLGMRIGTAPRPPDAPKAPAGVLVVEAVAPGGQAEFLGIREGDVVRAVTTMTLDKIEPSLTPDTTLGVVANIFDVFFMDSESRKAIVKTVLKCDGLTADAFDEALESNVKSPDEEVTLLLERPP